jgi:hypothetical protein
MSFVRRLVDPHLARGCADDQAALNESEETEAEPELSRAAELEDRLRGLERLRERGVSDKEYAPLRRALFDQLSASRINC